MHRLVIKILSVLFSDVTGKVVYTKNIGDTQAGEYTIAFEKSLNLVKGSYFVEVNGVLFTKVERLMIN